MRLIDADYAEKMLRSLGNRAFRRENGTIMDAIKMISNPSCTPTVDAVEVVRCKDCKHKGWIQEPCHGKSVDFCNVFDSTINNSEKCFCSYGERRKNEAD